ncbi:bifunctional 4-hydroxy-2-oxoglutarate aldolase/2-dehydro-3-deoxy-phosphogluconate aldolase [Nesterenkonia halophila]|uniref:bifunctional 4-hydroxy-2-oxoglutarate aldolase/2-dehydro-3-deoxy-phosphogluconate aldolase n=1 Tax=Nesterenkonia halophila TaxID=302044 RepID=UPI0012917828|nr:bifunctional 4-hydroxy-2-oxoglutarate aldolase/2-dehydro-3-deoxy-phosphogluconate aldolase [Nesterenkonia halophila]
MSRTPARPDPLDVAPVIPVVEIRERAQAVPLARALASGGVPIVEITLRTPDALEAVAAVAEEVPEILVGAGTVTAPDQVRRACDAGAQFLVSPGTTPALLAAMLDSRLPVLPGTATASEVLAVLEAGVTSVKFFPAEAAGGAEQLRALAGPVPEARFCPTGGITAASAPQYLALPNVACVGGTWLTPRQVVEAEDWDRIESLAREAAALAPPQDD